jgi:hypothetical protein
MIHSCSMVISDPRCIYSEFEVTIISKCNMRTYADYDGPPRSKIMIRNDRLPHIMRRRTVSASSAEWAECCIQGGRSVGAAPGLAPGASSGSLGRGASVSAASAARLSWPTVTAPWPRGSRPFTGALYLQRFDVKICACWQRGPRLSSGSSTNASCYIKVPCPCPALKSWSRVTGKSSSSKTDTQSPHKGPEAFSPDRLSSPFSANRWTEAEPTHPVIPLAPGAVYITGALNLVSISRHAKTPCPSHQKVGTRCLARPPETPA